MSRNEEKQLGRLNRIHLQKLHEDEKRKNPPRPKLVTLNTVMDITKWLPSIKRDIDFYLKQSQVTCYTERKVAEFSEKIFQLRKEYMAFIKKIRELQKGQLDTPWVDRKYRRRPMQAQTGEQHSDSACVDSVVATSANKTQLPMDSSIDLPVLTNDVNYKHLYGYNTSCLSETAPTTSTNGDDSPLEFSTYVKKQRRFDDNDESIVLSNIKCDNHSNIFVSVNGQHDIATVTDGSHTCSKQLGRCEICTITGESHGKLVNSLNLKDDEAATVDCGGKLVSSEYDDTSDSDQ